MVKNEFPKEGFSEIVAAYKIKDTQYYYLRVNPIEKDSDTFFAIEELYYHAPTQEDKTNLYRAWLNMAKRVKSAAIVAFDASEDVNIFEIDGIRTWLKKETRVGLQNSLRVEQAAGYETSTLYVNDTPITLPISKALLMLDELELYAIECYRTTEQHKANISALSIIEDVENYDHTANYPQHPVFSSEG